jgi:hypothetical protein
MAESHPGRQRLERTLVEMSRGRRARRPRGHEPDFPVGPAPDGEGREETGACRMGPSIPFEPADLAELHERLDRIERKLSDLARPFPASHESFDDWVRQGYWAHIRFSEFLRLKRAGML